MYTFSSIFYLEKEWNQNYYNLKLLKLDKKLSRLAQFIVYFWYNKKSIKYFLKKINSFNKSIKLLSELFKSVLRKRTLHIYKNVKYRFYL